MLSKSLHPETIVLHAGYRADPATTAVAVPIYQSTSYQFNSTEHAGNLFALPGDSSGDNHAFAALARGAAPDRRHRRLCAAVDRHRAY
jgi:cystathionine beta-lyase/cystathionine gamma-synthase